MGNYITDKRLSLKAKGILLLVDNVFSKNDITTEEICNYTKENKDEIIEVLLEISSLGYCALNHSEDIFNGTTYTVTLCALENDKKDNTPIVESNTLFIDKIYKLYPSKCPKRGISTGKTLKDKKRIATLLKTYSMEEIEMVVKHEVDSKLGKHPLKNFSTFLNNFPDPKEISETLYYPKSIEDVKDDDIKPTFTLFLDWLDDAAKKILETNRKGFPVNEKQYQRLIDVAIGGKRTLAYVTLVLNRDGYGVYEDERGFMWTYLNYIKANGLYKG